jgi:hypothetical protein
MRSLVGLGLVAVAVESFSVCPSHRHVFLVPDVLVRPRVAMRRRRSYHCLPQPGPLTLRTKRSCRCHSSGDGPPDTNDAPVTNSTAELAVYKVEWEGMGLGIEQQQEDRLLDFAVNQSGAAIPHATQKRDIPSIPDAILLNIEPPELRQDLVNWRARWNNDGRAIEPRRIAVPKEQFGWNQGD